MSSRIIPTKWADSSTPRSDKLLNIMVARNRVREGKLTCDQAFDWLFFASLEPLQRKALHYVVENGQATAADIAIVCTLSIQHASTLLKQLYDYGALDRERCSNAAGRYYQYRERKS